MRAVHDYNLQRSISQHRAVYVITAVLPNALPSAQNL